MSKNTSQEHPCGTRIDAVTAREFSYRVHTSKEPVLFRIHNSRSEANSRCWEWNKKRPVFAGLGVTFFVRKVSHETGEGYGIFGKPANNATDFIVHTGENEPLLRLRPVCGDDYGEEVSQ